MPITQTRVIEKRGLLIFSEEERSSYLTRVFMIVEQRQQNFSENMKLIPSRSHYGWATLMDGAYVCKDIQLQFQNQLIYEIKRDDIQNHIITSANLYEIADLLGEMSLENPAPPNELFLPPPPYQPVFEAGSHIQFCLETGVIIKVLCQIIPMYVPEEFEHQPFEEEPPLPPGGDKRENPPPVAPPSGAPPSSGLPGSGAEFEISPPYDGVDDGGLTWVPPFVPPWDGDGGQDPQGLYLVTMSSQGYTAQGVKSGQEEVLSRSNVPGKIQGLGTTNPNDPNASFGIVTTGQENVVSLYPNYQVKLGWPYPEYSFYYEVKIVSVLRQN